jgi:hypothetical protein
MVMRRLSIALVFLTGCVVGGASSRFGAPVPLAQAGGPATRWGYYCRTVEWAHYLTPQADQDTALAATLSEVGGQGWEVASVAPLVKPSGLTYCFKRALP